ncbi:MAG: hypothetical protein FWF20_08530 [Betaproteobacteria bacterium]|nr:hypothetical protein [Betaproteobacteria bacterium]MCL2886811.1 hypothetical protein [Betaproteobacteria bacterium]
MNTDIPANQATDDMPPPFWGRVPRFFLFALHPSILLRIGLYAALPVICIFTTSIMAGVVVFLGLSLLAWIFYLRLGSNIFSETSRGRLSPDQYDTQRDESLAFIPYAIFGLFFVASLAVGLVMSLFGEGAAVVANLIVNLLLPASLMVLIHTRSLIDGLSPGQVRELIGTIGKPYLLLVLFLFFLSSGQGFLTFKFFQMGIAPIIEKWALLQQTLMQQIQSEADWELVQADSSEFDAFLRRQRPRVGFALFGFNAAAMYFTTIAFNMMGYVLYQYHHLLGIEVDEPRARGSQHDKPHDATGEQIAELLAEGQMDKALDLAYEEQRVQPDSVPAQERYHKLLHLSGKTDRLLSHANRFIVLLLRQQMPGRALEILRRCREQSPDFRPEDPATLLALAQSARALRDPKQALDIMRAFDKKHPRHPLIPDVYYLSATILCEELRQDAMADRLFAAIIERYPQHPCAAQAEQYRATIARMQPQGKPQGASAA